MRAAQVYSAARHGRPGFGSAADSKCRGRASTWPERYAQRLSKVKLPWSPKLRFADRSHLKTYGHATAEKSANSWQQSTSKSALLAFSFQRSTCRAVRAAVYGLVQGPVLQQNSRRVMPSTTALRGDRRNITCEALQPSFRCLSRMLCVWLPEHALEKKW